MNQCAVHHLDYQENINDLLGGALNKLDKEEQVGYLEKGTEVITEAIAVYSHQSHAKLSTNLMEYMAPETSDSIKNNIKFILACMLYDKSITNAVGNFAGLLHEQNLYLEKYDDFCIGGIHKAVFGHEFEDRHALKSLMMKETNITNIHSTVVTTMKAIWTIKTTKDNITKAIQWTDNHFFELYTKILEEAK
eukprot:11569382-Ditylum_brightwellii.AAC.1